MLIALLAGPVLASEPDAGAAPASRRRTLADVKYLYFQSAGCGACKRLEASGVIDKLKATGVKVEPVDVGTSYSMLEKYGVTHTPTLVLVDATGFPLGRPELKLDAPDETLAKLNKLVAKMTK